MVRVMTGDALVGEHERLQARMNQFYERFESTLKQALRAPAESGQKPSDADVTAHAGMLVRYALGCLHQYAKSGFTKKPTESLAAQRRYVAA
jgi:TetR/AcrR family transcriptional regulator